MGSFVHFSSSWDHKIVRVRVSSFQGYTVVLEECLHLLLLDRLTY